MSPLFAALMIPAMLATVTALVLGLFTMVRGGEVSQKYGNKLMQARVGLQGLALLLLALALLTQGQ